MNGLKLSNIDTEVILTERQVKSWEDLQRIVDEYIQSGYVIAYLHYKVLIGKVKDKVLAFYRGETFDPKYLLKLRAFNEEKEVYLWRRTEGEFHVRFRIDGKGSKTDVVDAEQILWGTSSRVLGDGWTLLSENRGVELILPGNFEAFKDDKGEKRVKLKTRHYVGYNELGQAGYVDCRFMNII